MPVPMKIHKSFSFILRSFGLVTSIKIARIKLEIKTRKKRIVCGLKPDADSGFMNKLMSPQRKPAAIVDRTYFIMLRMMKF